MQVVYRHKDAIRVNSYKSLLEAAGLDSFIKNQEADTALVGVGNTISDMLPALCVFSDEDYTEARSIIQEVECL